MLFIIIVYYYDFEYRVEEERSEFKRGIKDGNEIGHF
jgi:hypothetical protein